MSATQEHIQESAAQVIGSTSEAAPDYDVIQKLSRPHYGFSPWVRIYVGDRVTGMVRKLDDEGRPASYWDVDPDNPNSSKMVKRPFLVTREWIEPCALNVFNNVTRFVPKNKDDPGGADDGTFSSMGYTVLEEHGLGQSGSRQFSKFGLKRPNLKAQTKYAGWIAQEIHQTYEENGFTILTGLMGLPEDVSIDAFTACLPRVFWQVDERMPGLRVPHLPRIIHFLRNETAGLVEKLGAKKDKEASILRVTSAQVVRSCQMGLSYARTLRNRKTKLVQDAKTGKPGPSYYDEHELAAFMAEGLELPRELPVEYYGATAGQQIQAESDPEIRELLKAVARRQAEEGGADKGGTKRIRDLEARLEKRDEEIAEMRAQFQEVLAAIRDKPSPAPSEEQLKAIEEEAVEGGTESAPETTAWE